MADYTVIGDIGETLKKLLMDDPWAGITPKPEITFKSPKEIKDDGGNANKVSLFLYQILEDPHMKNEERIRVNDSQVQLSSLVLDLFYLVTPYCEDKTQEKYILGKVMQIFYDHTILAGTVLQGSLAGSDEKLRLVAHPLSIDDLTKIWNAFQEVAYRLSVAYLLTSVRIDSAGLIGMQRVVTKEIPQAFMEGRNRGG